MRLVYSCSRASWGTAGRRACLQPRHRTGTHEPPGGSARSFRRLRGRTPTRRERALLAGPGRDRDGQAGARPSRLGDLSAPGARRRRSRRRARLAGSSRRDGRDSRRVRVLGEACRSLRQHRRFASNPQGVPRRYHRDARELRRRRCRRALTLAPSLRSDGTRRRLGRRGPERRAA